MTNGSKYQNTILNRLLAGIEVLDASEILNHGQLFLELIVENLPTQLLDPA